MADKTITNPTGAFGYTDLETQLWHLAAAFEASAAITGPAVVSVGTDGTVATAATNGSASLVVGIAQASASVGDSSLVTVQGIAENVPATGAVAAGDFVKRSVTTAGSVAATATPAAGEVIGVAINASASNVVDVWVSKGGLS